MKGRQPTQKEQKHMNCVADLGCIVCYNNGFPNTPAEIHHVYGRTKPNCHMEVLPLCYEHHRKGGLNGLSSPTDLPISRHPYKRRFEEAYGTEEQLLSQVNILL